MEALMEWMLMAQMALEIDPDARLSQPKEPSRLVLWLFGDPRGRGGWAGR